MVAYHRFATVWLLGWCWLAPLLLLAQAQRDDVTAAGSIAPQLIGADGLTFTQVAATQKLGVNGRGVRLCVIDNAIDITHPNFGSCKQPQDPAPCRVYFGMDAMPSAAAAAAADVSAQPAAAAAVPAGQQPEALPTKSFSVLNALESLSAQGTQGKDNVNPQSPLAAHGTHVAGIALGTFPDKLLDENGQPLPFQKGVAPGARLGAFKAGGSGGLMDYYAIVDSLNVASKQASCDIVSLSFGGFRGQPTDKLPGDFKRSFAALRASGAVSLAAAGNEGFSRGPWLFSVSHPAALPGVVAVAHLRNSANPGQLLQLDRPIETPTGQRDVLVGIQRADTKRSLSDIPLPKQLVLLKTTSLAEGCFPLATVTSTTDISNKIFVLQVTPDCNSYALRDSLAMWQQIRFSRPWLVLFALPTDEAASFSGVMTNNGDVPVIWLAAEDAAALVGVMTADLTTPISLKALPGATVQALPVEAAKLPADSSSMGPTFDLRIKPDVAGPGTLYSSVPNDGYETYAGTSMATPYISGVVALWLQKQRPLWAGSGKQPLGSWPLAAATAIKTTAKPVVYPGTTLVYPPLKVGAGTVQALSAAQSRVFVTPTELLVQTNKASQAFTLTVTNTGDEAVTYTLGHTPAVSVSLPKAWYKQAYDLDAPVARLTFVPATLTVPAGSAAQVKVTVATPSFMNNLDLIYSGYVTLTPPDAASGDATLSDYSDEPAGNATGSDPSATATSPPIILSVAYQGTSKDYSTFTARSLAFLPTPLPELDPVTANALKARGVAYVCADYFYNPGAPDSVSACNYEGGMIKSYKQTDRLMFAVSVLRPVASYTILVYNANGKTLLGTSRSGSDDVIITASPPLSRSFTAPWDGSFDAVSGGVQYLEVRKTYRFKLALFAPLAAADKQAGRQPSNRPFTVDVAGAVAIQPLG